MRFFQFYNSFSLNQRKSNPVAEKYLTRALAYNVYTFGESCIGHFIQK